MANDIRVRVTKATDVYPKDAELGFATEKAATSVLGEGAFEIIGYQNGQPYEAPKSAAKPDKKSEA